MALRAQIALVDDDELFRESLSENLVDVGFSVEGFADGFSALEFFKKGMFPDVILLDWKMPGMNGIEVLRQLRESGCLTPVIFLTVLGDQIYEEAALSGGATDFVEKSRSFSILLKRLEIILSGGKGAKESAAPLAQAPLSSGSPLKLDIAGTRASWRGHEIDLTLTEFNMVQLLASRAGQDVRYRELYDLVHGDSFIAGAGDEGYRGNVRTFIKRIRQKFRAVDSSFEAIENYPGFGYRWREKGGGK